MSDLISRQAAIDAIHNLYAIHGSEGEWVDQKDAFKAIKDLPSSQPDIIVCADCKHWVCHDRRCGYWNHGVKPLEWCSHAERKDDGENISE